MKYYNIEINKGQARLLKEFLSNYSIPNEEAQVKLIEENLRDEDYINYTMSFNSKLTCDKYYKQCKKKLKLYKDLLFKVEEVINEGKKIK